MKRTISLMLCLLMLAALCVGCGHGEHVQEDDDLIVVGFSQLGSESDWRIANTGSITEALCEENGYELILDNAKQKQENQLIAIRNFILQGVDIIVLAPASENGWENVLLEARSAGIPVIIVDREVSVSNESLYVSRIGSDFLREGQTAVTWLEEELSARGMSRKPVNILHIKGTDGATAQIQRTQALEEGVAFHDNWNIAAQLNGEFTEAKGYEVVRDFLQTNQNIDVIYSENDNMTFGAMRALDEMGLTYGKDGDIIIISFDAVREALRYCLEGRINLCVECNPLHGSLLDNLIKSYYADEDIPRITFVDETWFVPESLTEEIIAGRNY